MRPGHDTTRLKNANMQHLTNRKHRDRQQLDSVATKNLSGIMCHKLGCKMFCKLWSDAKSFSQISRWFQWCKTDSCYGQMNAVQPALSNTYCLTVNKNQALLQTLQHNRSFPWCNCFRVSKHTQQFRFYSVTTYITCNCLSVCSWSLSLLPEHPIISQLLNSLHHCWPVTTESSPHAQELLHGAGQLHSALCAHSSSGLSETTLTRTKSLSRCEEAAS